MSSHHRSQFLQKGIHYKIGNVNKLKFFAALEIFKIIELVPGNQENTRQTIISQTRRINENQLKAEDKIAL